MTKKFRVRFYKAVTTIDRHSIEVEAENADAARARVEAWGKGELELTDEEEETENMEREGEVDGSEYSGLEDADDPNAVVDIVEPDSYPHKISILWGCAPEPGDTAKTFAFATKAELDAFKTGIAEMDGWAGYREVEPGYVIPEDGVEA